MERLSGSKSRALGLGAGPAHRVQGSFNHQKLSLYSENKKYPSIKEYALTHNIKAPI